MSDLILLFISACLVNNLALEYLVGIDPALAVSSKIEAAYGLALTLLLVLPVTCVLTHSLVIYVIEPMALEFLQLFLLVIVIVTCLVLLEFMLKRFRPQLYEKVKVFFPLLLVNSAVLGAALLTLQLSTNLIYTFVIALGMASGFAIVVVIFAGIQERLATADIPLAFRGPAITLITLSILSMSFLGFRGLI